ncbi:unnamed protein product, partial [Hapterophycus canaliculatus]
VSPFVGFLKHREQQQARRGDMWLFFGCRNESQDWIFRREMEGFLAKGTLSRLSTAFSRDASEKVYVQ